MYQRLIIIVGMPRSGTSWTSQIIDSSPQVRFRLSPFFSYEFKNAVSESSSKEEYERVFVGAYFSGNSFMNQTQRREAGLYPTFKYKHDPPEVLAIKMTRFHNLLQHIIDLFPDTKVISIVRHPCGAINSWLKTDGEFPIDADPMKEWKTGSCRKSGPGEFWGFNDWKDVTSLYLRLEIEYPDQFKIIRYEDLVDDSMNETKELFHFLDLEYTQQTQNFLFESQRTHIDDPYAVYKKQNVKDRWKHELDPKIQEEIINELARSKLGRFLA
jgi:hypothetical protein